jgi:hypothetical protein
MSSMGCVGVSLHLPGPELVARGLEGFTISRRSLLDEVQLPAFESGQPSPGRLPEKSTRRCSHPSRITVTIRRNRLWRRKSKPVPRESGKSGKPLRRQLVRPGVVIGGRARRLTFCRSLRSSAGFRLELGRVDGFAERRVMECEAGVVISLP